MLFCLHKLNGPHRLSVNNCVTDCDVIIRRVNSINCGIKINFFSHAAYIVNITFCEIFLPIYFSSPHGAAVKSDCSYTR